MTAHSSQQPPPQTRNHHYEELQSIPDIERNTLYSRYERFISSRAAIAFVVSLALFTDMLVYGAIIPILPKIIQDMGRDPSDLGFLVGCYAFGLLAFTPLFGYISDKYGTRKLPMLAGLMGLVVSTILFALSKEYWQVVLARMAQGVSGGASWSIGLSMIADVYPRDRLGTVMGIVLSANTLGTLMGPPIGGIMSKYISYEAPFLFCATLALVDFVCRCIVKPHPVKPLADTALRKRSTMLQMLIEPSMLLMCFVTTIISTMYTAIEPTLPLHLKEMFQADTDAVGLVFMSVVIPNVFMSAIVGSVSDYLGHQRTTAIGVAVLALTAPLIALPTSYWGQVPTLMAFGGAAAFAMTPLMPAMAEYAEGSCGGAYGSVYALFNMAYSVGMLAGPLVAGFLYQSVGFFWQMSILSLCLLVLVPLLIMRQKAENKYSEMITDSSSLFSLE